MATKKQPRSPLNCLIYIVIEVPMVREQNNRTFNVCNEDICCTRAAATLTNTANQSIDKSSRSSADKWHVRAGTVKEAKEGWKRSYDTMERNKSNHQRQILLWLRLEAIHCNGCTLPNMTIEWIKKLCNGWQNEPSDLFLHAPSFFQICRRFG